MTEAVVTGIKVSAVLTFETLRLYVAIAESGSISAGAKSVGVSPSLASRKLVALEKEMKSKLVQRGTRTFLLTDSGQIFLDWSRRMVVQFADLSDQLEQIQTRPSGWISVACNEYVGPRYMPAIIEQFKRSHPDVNIGLTLTDEPLNLVEKGCDLVIHTGSIPPGNLIGRKIISYARVLCASPKYLSQRGVPSLVEDLAAHRCLTHTLTEPRTWYFRRGDGSIAVQTVDSAVQANSYPLLLDLAVRGLGIARISERMAETALKTGDVVRLLSDLHCCDAGGQNPGVWVIYPDRHLPYRVRLFADFLTIAMKQFHMNS